jgi:tripartite-type tricarboxylate transporter receptor subunit TctC
VVAGPTLLVVRNDLPVKTVKELIDHAKANPGKLSYGSVGIGSTTHLAGEMLNMTAGIDTIHVPYKGSTPILVDLMGGRLAFAFVGISGSLAQARAGQIRAIAISTLTRSPSAPDIPAVAETLPGFELNSWYGMMAPAGTPKPIVMRLNQELVRALKMPDVVEWMKQNGLAPAATPEEHAAYHQGRDRQVGQDRPGCAHRDQLADEKQVRHPGHRRGGQSLDPGSECPAPEARRLLPGEDESGAADRRRHRPR